VETIIGGKRDSEFGPVVMFGLGGIFVEALRDISMRVAPIGENAAMEMVREIKGLPLLTGTRGVLLVTLTAWRRRSRACLGFFGPIRR